MSERNNKMELLGSAPVPTALVALGVAIMIGMLINALYNMVDAYFVGGLGESPMGAISIVFPLGQVVVGVGLMFGNGAVIIILASVFLKPILTMLGATDTIMPYALPYARIYIISCIFHVFNVTMNNIVASEGAAVATAISQFVSTLV